MAIGTSKVGVLGGGGVPAGSTTFNVSGTFSVPPGVSKVYITGKGATGNPGNSGTSGNAGNFGIGGAGGGSGNSGRTGVGSQAGGRGGSVFTGFPIVGNSPNGPFPTLNIAGGNGGGGNPCTPVIASGNSGSAGSSGAGGSAGSAGNAGTSGNASTGLGYNFSGGAGGNAGAAGNAGTGGSGGPGGSGSSSSTGPGSAGASGGTSAGNGGAAGTGGTPTGYTMWNPCKPNAYFRWMGGGGGGGAGVCNTGASGNPGANGPVNIVNPYPGCCQVGRAYVTAGKAGAGGTATPVSMPYNSPSGANQPWSGPFGGFPLANPVPVASSGGRGGNQWGTDRVDQAGANSFCMRGGATPPRNQYRCNDITYLNNNPIINGFQPTNPAFRSGAGGAGGSGGSKNCCAVIVWGSGGAGGGGRGAVGNAGGCGGAGGSGSAGTPATYNCVSVTPGGTYPVVVGSPGGQVIISWNAQ